MTWGSEMGVALDCADVFVHSFETGEFARVSVLSLLLFVNRRWRCGIGADAREQSILQSE